MYVVVCLMLVAVLAVGCGGEDQTVRPATDADTVGLPEEERNYVSCLRKVGLRVRVPASVRKLASEGEYEKRTRNGVEGRFNLSFYVFDKRQHPTKEQIAAARECEEVRGSADKSGPPERSSLPGSSRPGSYVEASTPGSGGFIETPQSLSTRGVPRKFEGAQRRIYAQAKYACGQTPKGFARSMNALDLADLYSKVFAKAWRQAAVEGCRAGLRRKR